MQCSVLNEFIKEVVDPAEIGMRIVVDPYLGFGIGVWFFRSWVWRLLPRFVWAVFRAKFAIVLRLPPYRASPVKADVFGILMNWFKEAYQCTDLVPIANHVELCPQYVARQLAQ